MMTKIYLNLYQIQMLFVASTNSACTASPIVRIGVGIKYLYLPLKVMYGGAVVVENKAVHEVSD